MKRGHRRSVEELKKNWIWFTGTEKGEWNGVLWRSLLEPSAGTLYRVNTWFFFFFFVSGQSFSSLLYAPLSRLPRTMALKHLRDPRTKLSFLLGTLSPFHPLGSNVKEKRTRCTKTVFHTTTMEPRGTGRLVNWPHQRRLIWPFQLNRQLGTKMHPWFVTPGWWIACRTRWEYSYAFFGPSINRSNEFG